MRTALDRPVGRLGTCAMPERESIGCGLVRIFPSLIFPHECGFAVIHPRCWNICRPIPLV